MKKTLLLLAMSLVLAFSGVSVHAEDYLPTEDKYNIVYNVGDENAEGMYGMVAIKGSDCILDTSNIDNIYYIKQASADEEGNISFLNFAPKGVAPSADDFVECTVFIGGPGYDSAEAIGVLKKEKAVTPVEPEDPTYAVSGKVTSSVGVTPATITVNSAMGESVASVQAGQDGAYSVSVPAGEGYNVVMTKKGHCLYTITGVDVADAVVLSDVNMTSLAGDVNSSGDINFYDLKSVLDDFNKKTSASDIIDVNSDVNESGDINFYDLKTVLDDFYNKSVVQAYSAQ